MNKPNIYIIMGVSGCGKSTVGKLLGKELGMPFFDGDDFHPKVNVEKMSKGNALNDHDRKGWLISLNELAKENVEMGTVIACSALKKIYRDQLRQDVPNMKFVHLSGTKEEILKRMQSREGHFMPPNLLDSQFETLETPKQAFQVSIAHTPVEIVEKIKSHYNNNGSEFQ